MMIPVERLAWQLISLMMIGLAYPAYAEGDLNAVPDDVYRGETGEMLKRCLLKATRLYREDLETKKDGFSGALSSPEKSTKTCGTSVDRYQVTVEPGSAYVGDVMRQGPNSQSIYRVSVCASETEAFFAPIAVRGSFKYGPAGMAKYTYVGRNRIPLGGINYTFQRLEENVATSPELESFAACLQDMADHSECVLLNRLEVLLTGIDVTRRCVSPVN